MEAKPVLKTGLPIDFSGSIDEQLAQIDRLVEDAYVALALLKTADALRMSLPGLDEWRKDYMSIREAALEVHHNPAYLLKPWGEGSA